MLEAVEQVIEEAQRQLEHLEWEPRLSDLALAWQTATALDAAVGPANVQQAMPRIDRLEGLREALAALALTVARTHGHLAWFLAQCSSQLAPILHWRALDAPDGHAFGTTLPTGDQLTDAEEAVRLLAVMLTRTGHRADTTA